MAPAGKALACLLYKLKPKPIAPTPQTIFAVSKMNWRRAAVLA